MINLIKKGMQILNGELTRYEQLRVNAENEYQAMSCGAFNPRFLAKIKKNKHENDKNKSEEKNNNWDINNIRDEYDETQ